MHKPESKCLLKCPMLPLPWSPPCPTRPDLQRAEIVAFNVSLFPAACVQRDSLRNSPWALSNPPLPVQCYFQQCHSLYLPSEPVIAFKIRLERWIIHTRRQKPWLASCNQRWLMVPSHIPRLGGQGIFLMAHLHTTRPSPSACTLWLLTPQGENEM